MVSRLRLLRPLGRSLGLSLALSAGLAACGPVQPCADGSMLESPDGLGLTEAEHPEGWGDAECWHCHAEASIHRLGCTPGVDLQAVQQEVREQGLTSCATCHGGNGAGSDAGSGDSGEEQP